MENETRNAVLATLIDTDNDMLPIQMGELLKKRNRRRQWQSTKDDCRFTLQISTGIHLERDQHLVWHVLRLSPEHLMLELLDPERVLVSHPERYLSLRCMFMVDSVCI